MNNITFCHGRGPDRPDSRTLLRVVLPVVFPAVFPAKASALIVSPHDPLPKLFGTVYFGRSPWQIPRIEVR